MFLCTALPRIDTKGENFTLEIPSGRDRIEVSLNVNQMLQLQQAALMVVRDFFDRQQEVTPTAEIVPLKTRKRRA